MPATLSIDDLLDFLDHATTRGLMPAATAQALAVAVRNVFSVLDDQERNVLPLDDIDGIIHRFNNKRARDFNPTSLKDYGRRVKRAIELYLRWREDPANFTVPTRATSASRRRDRMNERLAEPPVAGVRPGEPNFSPLVTATGYQTALPVRPGHVVTISNIPHDLSAAEAERLAQFVRLLAGG